MIDKVYDTPETSHHIVQLFQRFMDIFRSSSTATQMITEKIETSTFDQSITAVADSLADGISVTTLTSNIAALAHEESGDGDDSVPYAIAGGLAVAGLVVACGCYCYKTIRDYRNYHNNLQTPSHV